MARWFGSTCYAGNYDQLFCKQPRDLVDAARGETLFRIPEGRLMTPSFAADARATVVQEPDGVRIVYSHPSLVSGEVRLKKVATGPWGQAPVRVTEIEECG